MAHKDVGRKTYRTMQGKSIDMDMLRKRHELTPAVGNSRVNARGDELGPGGQIVKKREEVVKEYYKDTQLVADTIPRAPTATKPAEQQSAPAPKSRKKTKAQSKQTPETTATQAEMDEWEEDSDGNFVKKGE